MSNSESANEHKQMSKMAQKCDEANGRRPQQGVKRSFSTPQSPLKIEQQRRNETFGNNANKSPTKTFGLPNNNSNSDGPSPPKRGCFTSLDPGSISLNPNQYDKPFPYFRRPKIVGSFSLDGKRKFHHDRSQLKFFDEKKLKDPKSFTNSYKRFTFDLREGVESAIKKDKTTKNEKLDKLLEWILMNKAAFAVNDQETNISTLTTDFVCFRGLLTTIMCTPYERREDWEFVALKYKETIYLCKQETEQQRLFEQNKSERQRHMESWGYKFEQFVLSDNIHESEGKDEFDNQQNDQWYNEGGTSSGKTDSESQPVNENEEFCCIFRSRLGAQSIVYGAEMDGFRLKGDQDSRDLDFLDLNSDGDFVELKTSRQIDNKRLAASFAQHKSLKWWAQSFLVGIRKILCGFRDDDGIVHSLEDYPIQKLPEIGKQWLPNICMNFLNEVLSFVYKLLHSNQHELVMYNFKWHQRDGKITVFEDKYNIQNVLPEWYLSKVFSQSNE